LAGKARPQRCSKEAIMTATPTPDAPLSPHWAFVVQLLEGTALRPEALHGRVEHIMSGQATHFSSVEDLLAFMARVLHPRCPED
jgi:hypothetical protein